MPTVALLPSSPIPLSSPLSARLHIYSVSPSDVPGGFSVIQGPEPREGGYLNLTCAANRHLYTALSWRRLDRPEGALSGQRLTPGEFSNFLALAISNLTAGHSGAYRCSARHRMSRKETHQDTQVSVISEWRSHSFGFYSTSSSAAEKKKSKRMTFLVFVGGLPQNGPAHEASSKSQEIIWQCGDQSEEAR